MGLYGQYSYKRWLVEIQWHIQDLNNIHQRLYHKYKNVSPIPHRIPARLHKMCWSHTADSFRGCGQVAAFLHFFWTWSNSPRLLDRDRVFHLIGNRPPKHSPPQTCLAIFEDLHISTHAERLLHILHFYAKKAILLSWKGSQIPPKIPLVKTDQWLFGSIKTHVWDAEKNQNLSQNMGQMAGEPSNPFYRVDTLLYTVPKGAVHLTMSTPLVASWLEKCMLIIPCNFVLNNHKRHANWNLFIDHWSVSLQHAMLWITILMLMYKIQ